MRGDISELCGRDGKGRIFYVPKRISPDKGFGIGGYSVCNKCGKDMPTCWDTVCKGCNKTFCYEHSMLVDYFWYCVDCGEKIFDRFIGG